MRQSAPDVLRRDDALAQRQPHKFDVGPDAELGADQVARVRGGLGADMQRLGDLIDGFLRQQHAQDLEFPRAQRVDRRGFVGEPVDGEFMVDVGTERDASGHDFGNRAQQHFGRTALRDKAACAGLDRLQRISGALVHREHEDACGLVPLSDTADRLDPANSRHRQVHDDEVGPGFLVDAIGVAAVAGLGHDLKPILLLQQRSIPLAHDGVVIGQHHARAVPGVGHV